MNPRNLLKLFFFLLTSAPLFSQSFSGIDCFENTMVSVESGESYISNCTGDGQPDVSVFDINAKGMPFGYVVTTSEDTVLLVTLNRSIDFEAFGEGTFKVYAFSFLGALNRSTGKHLSDSRLGSVCQGFSENNITVYNIIPDGKNVSTADGQAQAFTCPDDGQSDFISFATTSSDPFYTYVVTDNNNTILGYSNAEGAFDFETVAVEQCRVWGLSYAGDLLKPTGQNLQIAVFSEQCFDLSDNYVDIIRTVPQGGTVSLSDGNTAAILCGSDGLDDLLTLSYNSTSPAPYAFAVTTTDGVVLQVPESNVINAEGLGEDMIHIYGISYTGSLSLNPGDRLSETVLSSDCYDVSDNFVAVNLSSAQAGSISFSDGSMEKQICPGDAASDVLNFTANDAFGENYNWLITDTLNQVLFISAADNFDFENAAGNTHLRVWGLSYSGNLLVNTGDVVPGAALSDLCYDLSDNFLSVEAQFAVGGTLSLSDGSTSAVICTGDEFPDVLSIVRNGAGGINYAYILTDTNDILVSETLFDEQSLNFEGTPGTEVRVHGLSYFSAPVLTIGQAAAGLAADNDCNDLSDNFISVAKIFVDGGDIRSLSGEAGSVICSNDTGSGILRFSNTSTAELNYQYLLTSDDNTLLALLDGDSLATSELSGGDYLVWGLSYSGELLIRPGDKVSEAALSDACYELSANAYPISIESVGAGAISSASGENQIFVCAQDIYSDLLNFNHSGIAEANYLFLLTDEVGEILDFSASSAIEFNNVPSRIVRVWGLSFTGELTADLGDTLGSVALSDRCYDVTDNYIEIIREIPEAGSILFADGTSSFLTCPGSTLQSVAMDSSGTTSGPYAYLLTDAQNNILDIQAAGDQLDLSVQEGTEFHIWGLAYTGTLQAASGNPVLTSDLSDDCFDLSESYLTIFRQLPSASQISSSSGQDNINICPDGQENIIELSNTQSTPADYIYIVSNDAGRIVHVIENGSFDLNNLPEGNYNISGLAYNGNLSLQTDSLLADELAAQPDVCYTPSDNSLTVQVYIPESGDLFVNPPLTADNLNFCVGDGAADTVVFNSAFNSNGPNAKLVTDTNNVLIRIETEAFIDFDTYETGMLRVWRVFYTGELSVVPGDTVTQKALSTECYDLSNNFIPVQTTKIDGGSISSLAISNDENTIFLCDDGQPKPIDFSNDSEAAGSNYVYIITNPSNLILRVFAENPQDVASVGFKDLRVYGLSYSGTLNAAPGKNLTTTVLADGCYALSANVLRIVIDDAQGGDLTTAAGDTNVQLCMTPDEGLLQFQTSSSSKLGYLYILTNTANEVLEVYTDAEIDFRALPVGIYRVWGLSYSGLLNGSAAGQDVTQVSWSSDCFALSENYVTIDRRAAIDGGRLIPLNNDGSDVYYTCPGGDNSPLVAWEIESSDPNYKVVITDGNNVIRFPNIATNVLDFSGTQPGTYRIWGISVNGSVSLNTGADLDALLGDGCWELSANFIEIFNYSAEGGNIFAAGSQNNQVPIIAGNGVADSIEFGNDSDSKAKYVYLIIDQASDTLVDIIYGNIYDFDGTGQATLLVRGLSYTGNLTVAPGDVVSLSLLSDDCYETSANDITILKTDPNLRGEEAPSSTLRPSDFREVALAPNPVSSWLVTSFYVDLTMPVSGTLEIYQTNGQPVRIINIDLLPGLNRYNLDVADLDKGMYFMKINARGRIPQTVRFVVQ